MNLENDTIYFSSKSMTYSWLSNFYPQEIFLQNRLWPTVEHYFQAQKFLDVEYREMIRTTISPATAKRMGRSRNYRIKRGLGYD